MTLKKKNNNDEAVIASPGFVERTSSDPIGHASWHLHFMKIRASKRDFFFPQASVSSTFASHTNALKQTSKY